MTKQAGLDISLFGMGVTVGDVDNDGWPDVFLTAVGGNRLFRKWIRAGGERGVGTAIPRRDGIGKGRRPRRLVSRRCRRLL